MHCSVSDSRYGLTLVPLLTFDQSEIRVILHLLAKPNDCWMSGVVRVMLRFSSKVDVSQLTGKRI